MDIRISAKSKITVLSCVDGYVYPIKRELMLNKVGVTHIKWKVFSFV